MWFLAYCIQGPISWDTLYIYRRHSEKPANNHRRFVVALWKHNQYMTFSDGFLTRFIQDNGRSAYLKNIWGLFTSNYMCIWRTSEGCLHINTCVSFIRFNSYNAIASERFLNSLSKTENDSRPKCMSTWNLLEHLYDLTKTSVWWFWCIPDANVFISLNSIWLLISRWK